MIGKTLAHYEITSQIGKGGMGEVYQAKDQKLGRDVAIKVLPEEFARETDRVARFQREAKLLASLNHPNIASIYGLEETDGTNLLVMELIDGDTLADRLESGPIPVEEALNLGLQIAEALEAAHEKGVIHRDLKPANIKITSKGRVKVLDFGLAKAFSRSPEQMNLSDSPTLSATLTQQGVILGTAAYMSPEQARGIPVDKRTDIWAFGVVLFEMLAGKPAFSGRDVTDTLAAVIRSEPEWINLPENLHWRLKEVLGRCLEKEAEDRYRDIADTRVDIQKVLTDPSGLSGQPINLLEGRNKIKIIFPWAAVILILGLIIAGVAVWKSRKLEPKMVMNFTYDLPENQQFNPLPRQGIIPLTVSPDGSQYIYCTNEGLFLHSLEGDYPGHIPGTNKYSLYPFFSPDGKYIGYWSQTEHKLKKIMPSRFVPEDICSTGYVFGASWSLDNTIVYSDLRSGIVRVSPDGGDKEILLKENFTRVQYNGFPISPQMLPDGETLLYTRIFDANLNETQIEVQSLGLDEPKILLKNSFDGKYIQKGYLFYVQNNNNLMSLCLVPFDLGTLAVTGEKVIIADNVLSVGGYNEETLVNIPNPSNVSVPDGSTSIRRELVWVSRDGFEIPLEIPADVPKKDYMFPDISPDGEKVAFTDNAGKRIYIQELVAPFTFNPLNPISRLPEQKPIWSPNGEKIFYSTGDRIYSKAADGTGESKERYSDPNLTIYPFSWLNDGSDLVIAEVDNFVVNIAVASMGEEHVRKSLLENATLPQVSPDGKYIAFCSDRTGNYEIYVSSFPDMTNEWTISLEGGNSPRWSSDGKELFYLVGNFVAEKIMRVKVDTFPTFRKIGNPELLFEGNYVGTIPMDAIPYDIHPDGDRFLMIKDLGKIAEESTLSSLRTIRIVSNWLEYLNRQVPVD